MFFRTTLSDVDAGFIIRTKHTISISIKPLFQTGRLSKLL